MSASSHRVERDGEPPAEGALRAWARSRAPVLVAVGTLLALLAILIVISLLHPR